MEINKENLLTIKDLKLAGIIEKMDDGGFAEYCKALDEFTENFPAQELELKNSFKEKDYDYFIKILLNVKDMLIKIYAEDLAQNCLKLMNDVKTTRAELVEAYLTYFLTATSMLSIDIQMAQHKGSKPEPQSGQAEEITEAEGEDKSKSILAVDDVSLILNMLKSTLQNTPYKFTGVTSGEAALRFIKNHRPDLFLLDIEMPKMNGYELAEKIKESGQTAPIIFLTGNATKKYVLKAIQVGAADFIVKPINNEQVLEKIKNFIG